MAVVVISARNNLGQMVQEDETDFIAKVPPAENLIFDLELGNLLLGYEFAFTFERSVVTDWACRSWQMRRVVVTKEIIGFARIAENILIDSIPLAEVEIVRDMHSINEEIDKAKFLNALMITTIAEGFLYENDLLLFVKPYVSYVQDTTVAEHTTYKRVQMSTARELSRTWVSFQVKPDALRRPARGWQNRNTLSEECSNPIPSNTLPRCSLSRYA